MRNTGLEETQAGIKIAGRNINNLRYADDTTIMAESEKELNPLDESERGEWKSRLRAQHSENKDHGIFPITSWEIDGETVETVSDFILGGSKNMPANLENSAVATGLEKISFHSNPKERQYQRMLKLLHNCTHLTC